MILSWLNCRCKTSDREELHIRRTKYKFYTHFQLLPPTPKLLHCWRANCTSTLNKPRQTKSVYNIWSHSTSDVAEEYNERRISLRAKSHNCSLLKAHSESHQNRVRNATSNASWGPRLAWDQYCASFFSFPREPCVL